MVAPEDRDRHVRPAGSRTDRWGTLWCILVLALSGATFQSSAWARGERHRVAIAGMAFSPSRLEVKAGDTVVWENHDLVPHDVTATNGRFKSPVIAPGRSWKFKARQAGGFSYYCSLHPSMKADLLVK